MNLLALRDHDEDRVALALEHLQLGHCVAVHGQELHLFPSLHLMVYNLILNGSLDADAFKTNNCNRLLRIHLKLDIELVDEEVDGRGGPGPARVDVQQEEALPLQQGLPLARVLGAFCKLVFLLSCHLAVKEYWHLYKKKYISPSINI